MEIKKILEEIASLKEDLVKDIPSCLEGKKEILKGVYAGENVIIEPNVFFDTSTGDIVIGSDTRIKANAVLRGPLIIGNKCIINCFSEISQCRVGDVCKIGGEVEVSIFEGYSNKQHHGFLGHSYVGKWVNIGGGTSVSNMKNTYGVIKMKGEESKSTFLGCIFEDYVKTAVNTSIFCGKVIGASSHIYGTVTEDVPAFSSYVSTGNMYELPLDLAKKIQGAMMKRRGLEFSDKEDKLFDQLFKDTEEERQKAGVKKDKLSFK